MGPCSPCPGERNPNRDCRHRKTPPHSRRPTCRRAPSLPKTRGGSPQQALISNRSKECREECGTMVFVTIAGVSFGSPSRAGRSLGRRRPASVPRRLRPKLIATHFLAKRSPGPAASRIPTLLCHSERSEESFPLRTKGCGRTMPSKEEKDKRSAVKHLYTVHTDSSSLCSSE